MVMVWPGAKPAGAGDRDRRSHPRRWPFPPWWRPACRPSRSTAVSWFAPVSITIVWPAAKSATLATLILFAPAADGAARVVAVCNRKSLQLLSVSAPSGKRPALLIGRSSRAAAARRSHPRPPAPGAATRQPFAPAPDIGLIAFRGPRVDQAAVVEAVDDPAAASRSTMLPARWAKGRATEPLVRRRRALIARRRDRGVAHHRVDRVIAGQGLVERDAGAERPGPARCSNGQRPSPARS